MRVLVNDGGAQEYRQCHPSHTDFLASADYAGGRFAPIAGGTQVLDKDFNEYVDILDEDKIHDIALLRVVKTAHGGETPSEEPVVSIASNHYQRLNGAIGGALCTYVGQAASVTSALDDVKYLYVHMAKAGVEGEWTDFAPSTFLARFRLRRDGNMRITGVLEVANRSELPKLQ
ncbi:hypothetical protein HPB47_024514 [Ixodes persulcatus]|uniref:Uncharacterized protein n=1 Tax=Ixodes persulcatus TaxID=34615 RepID=A0AC60Q420_IXOPE|nr:hypothetical protein HPB47_024514 [Ixodes persulcatus]